MLTSLALFSTVALVSLVLTATGLKYSTDMIEQMAAATPVKTTNLRPGYIAHPTVARADDLNVARSVPVVTPEVLARTPVRTPPPRFHPQRMGDPGGAVYYQLRSEYVECTGQLQ